MRLSNAGDVEACVRMLADNVAYESSATGAFAGKGAVADMMR